MCWQQKQQVVSFPLCLTQKVLSEFAKNKFTNSFIHQNSLEATEMMNAMSYFYCTHHSIRLPVGWMCHVWPTQHNDCYCFCCSRSMNPSFTAKTLLSWSVLCDTTAWHSRHIPANFALFCSVQEQELEILRAYFVEVIKSSILTHLLTQILNLYHYLYHKYCARKPCTCTFPSFLLATDPLWCNNT